MWHCFDQDSRPAECACSVSVSKMINLLNDSYWKQTHATCTVQHADDWKRDRETGQRIDYNTVRKYHDACATTPVHACRRKNNKIPITRPEETSHNSIGHGTQVSTRIRTHNSFQTCSNNCRDLLQKSWTFTHASHHNSWTFVPDHPTISNLTFRSHSPSVDVFAWYVTTLDQCYVLIVRHRNNHTKLKRVVAWLEYII